VTPLASQAGVDAGLASFIVRVQAQGSGTEASVAGTVTIQPPNAGWQSQLHQLRVAGTESGYVPGSAGGQHAWGVIDPMRAPITEELSRTPDREDLTSTA
jgi:hypothetical protein